MPQTKPQTSPMNRPSTALLGAALALALLAAAPPAARADAPPPPPPDGVWTGKGQGGLLVSSGNTTASSLNAKLDLSETDGPWKNTVYVGGLYGKANGILNGERLEGRYELDHKISGALYWFGSASGVKDLFSGFNYQATVTGGLGYTVFDTTDTTLSTTLGVGYQRLQTQSLTKDASGAVTERVNGPAEGGVIGTAGLNFKQRLTATTALTDKLLVTAGSLNTAVGNDLALAVNLSDRLALSLGYGIRYNTEPAAGVRKLDQVETVNVVFNIK